ncbi:TetR/AcrR family transcriptional regulator [Mycetohabitans rhizoxinica]|uniref:TetR/AcrR family transcriptional regulator n=1 Tax=Mycetohabitans rhizoxinica TaxID=412963 RepID=UPI0030CAE21B
MSRSNQPFPHGRTPSAGTHRRTPTAGADAQQQLLNAAARLFYAQGIRAVGIDAVVEQAGVNKMSLYRQFASKDELVVAYLNRMDAEYWQRFECSTAQHPGQPARQLKQFFEDLTARARRPDYRGCPFVNVSCEFSDRDHPARQIVARNKTALLERLTDLARQAGAHEPARLGASLALLVEGVYTASQTFDPRCDIIDSAPALAAQLIDAATAPCDADAR